MLRNSFLKDRGVITKRHEAKGNPSMALSRSLHNEVHAEERRLKGKLGLGANEYMRNGKLEIRLMNQAMFNILVKKYGLITKQELRMIRKQAEKYAKKKGCYYK